MPALTSDDLAEFLGVKVDYDQAESILRVVAAMASSYTRGEGFTGGQPEPDLRAVILTASARLLRDRGVNSESMGPFQVSYRGGFEGWTVAELAVLNRYRERSR